jgi:hypothetical protein
MPCVKHGYCYAKEPFQYVPKVLAIYEHYKNGKKKKNETDSESAPTPEK